jgi:hypothetical protein
MAKPKKLWKDVLRAFFRKEWKACENFQCRKRLIQQIKNGIRRQSVNQQAPDSYAIQSKGMSWSSL